MAMTQSQKEAVAEYRRLVKEGFKKTVAAQKVGFSRWWIRTLDKQLAAEEAAANRTEEVA